METQEKLNEHQATVLKFMGKRQAICIKANNEIAGVMLFSRGHNMICCLAVSPEYHRRGVASMLMDEALANLDRTKEISVSTFRADDEKGAAPRALYEKYGFIEDALIEEMGYPNQKMLSHFNVSPKDAVYFGDDNDDIEPIKNCGLGIAVSNAIPSVLEVADRVIDSNDSDGVAKYIEESILNGWSCDNGEKT